MMEFIQNINKMKVQVRQDAAKLEKEMFNIFKEKGREGVIKHLNDNGLSKTKMQQFLKALEMLDEISKDKSIESLNFDKLESLLADFNKIK
jgi:hypothetical protein